jgi:4-amino-4-deoxy-L-arabinose transferase-like glycosyltransferase
MMFVFAYIAQSMGLSHNEWPLRLIYLTEAAFVIVAFVCVLLAGRLRGTGPQPWRVAVAFVGGVSVSLGLIMPLELAPMFFRVHGEWMMATMVLILLYPIAAVLFTLGFSKFMKVDARANNA